jgi:hypothetical protein
MDYIALLTARVDKMPPALVEVFKVRDHGAIHKELMSNLYTVQCIEDLVEFCVHNNKNVANVLAAVTQIRARRKFMRPTFRDKIARCILSSPSVCIDVKYSAVLEPDKHILFANRDIHVEIFKPYVRREMLYCEYLALFVNMCHFIFSKKQLSATPNENGQYVTQLINRIVFSLGMPVLLKSSADFIRPFLMDESITDPDSHIQSLSTDGRRWLNRSMVTVKNCAFHLLGVVRHRPFNLLLDTYNLIIKSVPCATSDLDAYTAEDHDMLPQIAIVVASAIGCPKLLQQTLYDIKPGTARTSIELSPCTIEYAKMLVGVFKQVSLGAQPLSTLEKETPNSSANVLFETEIPESPANVSLLLKFMTVCQNAYNVHPIIHIPTVDIAECSARFDLVRSILCGITSSFPSPAVPFICVPDKLKIIYTLLCVQKELKRRARVDAASPLCVQEGPAKRRRVDADSLPLLPIEIWHMILFYFVHANLRFQFVSFATSDDRTALRATEMAIETIRYCQMPPLQEKISDVQKEISKLQDELMFATKNDDIPTMEVGDVFKEMGKMTEQIAKSFCEDVQMFRARAEQADGLIARMHPKKKEDAMISVEETNDAVRCMSPSARFSLGSKLVRTIVYNTYKLHEKHRELFSFELSLLKEKEFLAQQGTKRTELCRKLCM